MVLKLVLCVLSNRSASPKTTPKVVWVHIFIYVRWYFTFPIRQWHRTFGGFSQTWALLLLMSVAIAKAERLEEYNQLKFPSYLSSTVRFCEMILLSCKPALVSYKWSSWVSRIVIAKATTSTAAGASRWPLRNDEPNRGKAISKVDHLDLTERGAALSE